MGTKKLATGGTLGQVKREQISRKRALNPSQEWQVVGKARWEIEDEAEGLLKATVGDKQTMCRGGTSLHLGTGRDNEVSGSHETEMVVSRASCVRPVNGK